ncbi:MAG: ABC transporter ATP-binding protein [Candidatus Hodarchaeales archaeon]
MENIIRKAVIMSGVSKSFRNGLVQALKKTYLEIEKGEFIVFGGPSGSGKTTLLNLIGGLDRPTEGSIVTLGYDYGQMSENDITRFRRKNIGFIWQFGNLFPSLNALQNVMLPLEFDPSWTYNEAKKRSKEVLEYLGLDDRLDHRPGQLSGGEQQRVAIARAIVNNPEIILADEPTGNVDSENGEMIAHLLKKLNIEQKITIIVVTHDISLFKTCGKVTIMRDGNILLEPSIIDN